MMSTHGWGAVKNPFCLGFQCPISVFVDFHWHSIYPWLRSHYKPFGWGPMLLALHVHPTSTSPVNHYWQNSSSMAGEPVKNPFSVAYWVTPKTFLGLFSASAVSPLAGTLNYCSMTHGQITFSFWVISWCNP